MSAVIETVSRSTNMDKKISQSLYSYFVQLYPWCHSVCAECEAKEPSVVNYEERAGGGQRSAQHPSSLSSFDPLISNFPSLNKLNSQTQLSTGGSDGRMPASSFPFQGDPLSPEKVESVHHESIETFGEGVLISPFC